MLPRPTANDRQESKNSSGLDQTWRDEQAARTPLKRLARPEEVGAAVLAVATTLRYSNGCIIPVDGGRPLT